MRIVFEKSKAIFLFKNKGDITMKQNNEKTKREEYLYHNTEILLKRYREVVWSIEVSAAQAKMNLELELDCGLDELLKFSQTAGIDLSGTNIQEQLRTVERNRKMIKIIDQSVEMLKTRYGDGELYYWILYYTYLSPKQYKKIEDIIKLVAEKTEEISWKTYFDRRKKAIKVLSNILWGFTTKDFLPILNELDKKQD